MKLISWNVNGLRAILKKDFMKFLQKENPDILCLQETKINHQHPFLNLDYKIYWAFAEKKGYAGTCIFTKKQPLSVSHMPDDKEGRVLTLEFEKFFLVNVYVPNSGRGLPRLDYRKKWDKEFLKYLQNLDKQKPLIICGDLNVAHTEIDLANPKSNYNKTAGYTQTEIDGFKTLLNSNFKDTFRMFNKEPGNYTYWGYWNNLRQRNIGWRIDYFIVSERFSKNIKSAGILKDVRGSDHCPISLIINN